MRRGPTEAEAKLWSMFRAKRLDGFKFKRQVQIGAYIVDFVCFEKRLIVEADGSQHANNQKDRQRDAWLAEEGFAVLRFWNNDILGNLEGVRAAILDQLHSSPISGEDSKGCAQGALPELGEGE